MAVTSTEARASETLCFATAEGIAVRSLGRSSRPRGAEGRLVPENLLDMGLTSHTRSGRNQETKEKQKTEAGGG